MTQIRNKERRVLLFVGPLPPPLHGQSLVTQYISELVAVAKPMVFDTACKSVIKKMWIHLRACASIPGTRVIYISVNSGKGMFLSAIIAAVASVFAVPVILHYHSGEVARVRRVAAVMLSRLIDKAGAHLVLTEGMREDFCRMYPAAKRVIVLPNAAVVSERAKVHRERNGLVLGFIGNLAPDKGLDTAYAVFERLRAIGVDASFTIAGPGSEETIREVTAWAAKHAGRLLYRNAVYGDEKSAFYRDIDVLLFPSRYRHEAQPVVVLEALAHGVPVLGTDVGYLPEAVGCGGAVFPASTYVESAAAWCGDLSRATLSMASNQAVDEFRAQRSTAVLAYDRLIGELCVG